MVHRVCLGEVLIPDHVDVGVVRTVDCDGRDEFRVADLDRDLAVRRGHGVDGAVEDQADDLIGERLSGDEVTERVGAEDFAAVLSVDPLGVLDDVRVGTDDEVGAPVGQVLSQLLLFVGDDVAVFDAPVAADDDDVGELVGSLDLFLDDVGLARVDDALVSGLRSRDAVRTVRVGQEGDGTSLAGVDRDVVKVVLVPETGGQDIVRHVVLVVLRGGFDARSTLVINVVVREAEDSHVQQVVQCLSVLTRGGEPRIGGRAELAGEQGLLVDPVEVVLLVEVRDALVAEVEVVSVAARAVGGLLIDLLVDEVVTGRREGEGGSLIGLGRSFRLFASAVVEFLERDGGLRRTDGGFRELVFCFVAAVERDARQVLHAVGRNGLTLDFNDGRLVLVLELGLLGGIVGVLRLNRGKVILRVVRVHLVEAVVLVRDDDGGGTAALDRDCIDAVLDLFEEVDRSGNTVLVEFGDPAEAAVAGGGRDVDVIPALLAALLRDRVDQEEQQEDDEEKRHDARDESPIVDLVLFLFACAVRGLLLAVRLRVLQLRIPFRVLLLLRLRGLLRGSLAIGGSLCRRLLAGRRLLRRRFLCRLLHTADGFVSTAFGSGRFLLRRFFLVDGRVGTDVPTGRTGAVSHISALFHIQSSFLLAHFN